MARARGALVLSLAALAGWRLSRSTVAFQPATPGGGVTARVRTIAPSCGGRRLLLLLSSGSLCGQAAVATDPVCRPLAEVLKDPVSDEVYPEQYTVSPSDPKSLWQFTGFVNKKEVQLNQFKRKAAIVVNVASECGLRFQFYDDAKALLNKYRAKGLQIIAVPLNEFQNTAPQSSACEKAKLYEGVGESSFPVLDKTTSGAPFFAWLTSQEPSEGGPSGMPQTSYEKFLINPSGSVVKRYGAFDGEWVADASKEIDKMLR